jgi:diguanylate cyclase (GGDEF)-like protein
MPKAVETPRARRVLLRTLLGRITIVLVAFTIAVYVGIYARTRDLAKAAVEEQAHSYLELIVQSRAWNARYGGVYVEKTPGVDSNRYLEELGVDADVTCTDDMVFTLRNPALMVSEIAELVSRDSGVVFHLTSLDPINPDNEPDAWERERLESFEDSDVREAGEFVEENVDAPVYRYMVPLLVEDSCVSCHASQGYSVGEIRGAISVTVPAGNLDSEMRLNATGLAALAVLTLVGIVGTVYAMSARVVDRLEEAERQLEHLATTDSLTDLWNRRYMLRRLRTEFDRSKRQGHDLGLVLFDLDHFKEVNDRFGHAYGDRVLQAAAQRMHGAIRDYDVLGRFGGEEFLVIVPETDSEGVLTLADRIRTAVGAQPVEGPEGDVTVTTSAGVAMLAEGDLSPDAILARADGALYAAKRMGRDRVVMGESAEDFL